MDQVQVHVNKYLKTIMLEADGNLLNLVRLEAGSSTQISDCIKEKPAITSFK